MLDAGSVTRFDSILVGCVAGLLFASPLRDTTLRVAAKPPVWIAALTITTVLLLTATAASLYNGLTTVFCVASAVLVLAALNTRKPLAVGLSIPPLVLA